MAEFKVVKTGVLDAKGKELKVGSKIDVVLKDGKIPAYLVGKIAKLELASKETSTSETEAKKMQEAFEKEKAELEKQIEELKAENAELDAKAKVLEVATPAVDSAKTTASKTTK